VITLSVHEADGARPVLAIRAEADLLVRELGAPLGPDIGDDLAQQRAARAVPSFFSA
jgi:hypothetical protein